MEQHITIYVKIYLNYTGHITFPEKAMLGDITLAGHLHY